MHVPAVVQQASTQRVLAVEWMNGVAVRATGHRQPRPGPRRARQDLLRVMLRQILIDGVFHADPHPGIVLVRADGTLALIDFGSVGRLDPVQQSVLLRAGWR